jgi:hypothetical protein
MYPSKSLVVAYLVLNSSILSCKNVKQESNIKDITGESLEKFWISKIKPATFEQLQEKLRFLTHPILKDPETGKSVPIVWSYIQGNHCKERAIISGAILAGAKMPIDPSKISRADAASLIQSPAIDSAKITVFGRLNLEANYKSDKLNQKFSKNMTWMNHTAIVVNIGGVLSVVDLSASSSPLPLKDWINKYVLHDDVIKTCPLVNKSEAGSFISFYSLVSQAVEPRETPKSLCMIAIEPLFQERWDFMTDKPKPAEESVADDLDTASNRLASDANDVLKLLGISQISQATSPLESTRPESIDAYCKKMTALMNSTAKTICYFTKYRLPGEVWGLKQGD